MSSQLGLLLTFGVGVLTAFMIFIFWLLTKSDDIGQKQKD